MEAPIPICIENFQNTIDEQLLFCTDSKEYFLDLDNISYKLTIYPEKNEINFKIEKNNELLLYNYKSKYHFKDIISILKLPLEIYNNSNKVIDLIDKAYEEKKLLLKFDKKNIDIFLIINNRSGFQEIDFPIKINRIDSNINQKFDIILKELKILRENTKILIDAELLEFEKIVKSLKETVIAKLMGNFSLIERLKQQIENNKN